MQNTEDWLKIIIRENPTILEELSTRFFDMGCQGIEEGDDQFILYFHSFVMNDAFKLEINNILDQNNIKQEKLSYDFLKNENWNEKWKDYFKTFRVGKNIIIKPDWEIYQAGADEKVITITPKMAFGTGHHETTQLILKQLEEIIKPGMSVLDAGTGSAILAIYAALIGSKKITAFDIDPVAIENAYENIQLNNVTEKITLQCGSLNAIAQEKYDVIIANINRNVLIEIAPEFKNYATENTILVLSGLLIADREIILKAYATNNWKLLKSDIQGEWLSLNFVYSKY